MISVRVSPSPQDTRTQRHVRVQPHTCVSERVRVCVRTCVHARVTCCLKPMNRFASLPTAFLTAEGCAEVNGSAVWVTPSSRLNLRTAPHRTAQKW